MSIRHAGVLACFAGIVAGCGGDSNSNRSDQNPFVTQVGNVAVVERRQPAVEQSHESKPPESTPAPQPAVAPAPPPTNTRPESQPAPAPAPSPSGGRPPRDRGRDPGRKPRDTPPEEAPRRPEEQLATDELAERIRGLGGKINIDEKDPERPVRSIDLKGTDISDNDLQLLRGLSGLHTLNLSNTAITGKGLQQLEGLTNLHNLNLDGTKVMDRDLQYLQGLTSLREISLYKTTIRPQSINALKKMLPKAKIKH